MDQQGDPCLNPFNTLLLGIIIQLFTRSEAHFILDSHYITNPNDEWIIMGRGKSLEGWHMFVLFNSANMVNLMTPEKGRFFFLQCTDPISLNSLGLMAEGKFSAMMIQCEDSKSNQMTYFQAINYSNDTSIISTYRCISYWTKAILIAVLN